MTSSSVFIHARHRSHLYAPVEQTRPRRVRLLWCWIALALVCLGFIVSRLTPTVKDEHGTRSHATAPPTSRIKAAAGSTIPHCLQKQQYLSRCCADNAAACSVILTWPDDGDDDSATTTSGTVTSGLPPPALLRDLRTALHPRNTRIAVVTTSETLRALFMVVCTASTRTLLSKDVRNVQRTCLAVGSHRDPRLGAYTCGGSSSSAVRTTDMLGCTTPNIQSSVPEQEPEREPQSDTEPEPVPSQEHQSPLQSQTRSCRALLDTHFQNAASFKSLGLTSATYVAQAHPPSLLPLPLHVVVTLGNCPISGQRASIDTERRVEQAVRLYRQQTTTACTLLLWSGGRVLLGGAKPVSEAQMMAALAVVLHNVPSHVMELEDASQSTIANARNSALMLRRGYPWRQIRDATTFTLVAKRKHLAWALDIFRNNKVFATRISASPSVNVKAELLAQMCDVFAVLLREQRACLDYGNKLPAPSLPSECRAISDNGNNNAQGPSSDAAVLQGIQQTDPERQVMCRYIDTSDNEEVLSLLIDRIRNVFADKPGLD